MRVGFEDLNPDPLMNVALPPSDCSTGGFSVGPLARLFTLAAVFLVSLTDISPHSTAARNSDEASELPRHRG